jgi:hypothetical protein
MKIIKITVENDTGETFTREQVGETVLWYSHDIEIDSANSRELEYQYQELSNQKVSADKRVVRLGACNEALKANWDMIKTNISKIDDYINDEYKEVKLFLNME